MVSETNTDCQQWILYKYLKVIKRHTIVSDAILGLKQLDYLTDDEFESLQKCDAGLRIGVVLTTILKKGSPEVVFHAFLSSLRDEEGQLEMGHSHLVEFLLDKYHSLKKLKQRSGLSGDPTLATQKEYDQVERENGSRPYSPPKSPSVREETFKSIKEDFLKWLKDTFRKEMDPSNFLSALKMEVCTTIQDCLGSIASRLGLSDKAAKDGTKEASSDSLPPCKSHDSVSSDHSAWEVKGRRERKICRSRDEIKMKYGYDYGMQQLAKTSEDVSEDPTKKITRSYCMQSFSVTSAKMLGEVLGRDSVLDASQCEVGHVLWQDNASCVNVGQFGKHQVAVKTRRSGSHELSVKEAFILSQLQSPNIVPLFGVFWTEGPATVKLVIECPSATLEEYHTTDSRQLERIALHLCQGLAKLKGANHGMAVVHNDISCRNCFIRGDESGSHMTAALGGFTFAEIAKGDGTCTALQVQPAYKHDYDRVNYSSHGSDVRAFAIVVHSLYNGPSGAPVMEGCPPRPPNMPEGLHDVLQECYKSHPSTRPSAMDLLPKLHALHELHSKVAD